MKKIIITNDPQFAQLSEKAGVERIMVDLEVLGKNERQGHLNTVISNHTHDDVKSIRSALSKSDLLVRVNPIHELSAKEIDMAIKAGADIIMLPMFTSANEVEHFVKLVNGRAKTILLLETTQALVRIDDILSIQGIDEVHIGLNDLHLQMHLDFMFELLSGGLIEYLANKLKSKQIPFGIGGIARVSQSDSPLNPELILSEHVRLGSSMVILSRDFKSYSENFNEIVSLIDLPREIALLEERYQYFQRVSIDELQLNKQQLKTAVDKIIMTAKRTN